MERTGCQCGRRWRPEGWWWPWRGAQGLLFRARCGRDESEQLTEVVAQRAPCSKQDIEGMIFSDVVWILLRAAVPASLQPLRVLAAHYVVGADDGR